VSAQAPSILNDILGPVMRGPSSSHTAGSFHIARLARALLGAAPVRARFAFDPAGSYAQVYRQQGVDRAFAIGLLGWPITDERFFDALDEASAAGVALSFAVEPLDAPDHPNTVDVRLESADGAVASVRAKSVGGGAVEVTRFGDWPVHLTGETYCALADVGAEEADGVRAALETGALASPDVTRLAGSERCLLVVPRAAPLGADRVAALEARAGVAWVRETPPVAFVKSGPPLVTSAREMIAMAEKEGWSLGRVGMACEAALLGLQEHELREEMVRRLAIMRTSVHAGLSADVPGMQLLSPTARLVMEAEANGRLAVGGLHARAAARAMAVMHVNGGMGVVCAAPTGGSAGVLPGVLVSLVEDRGLDVDAAADALFAASAVGLVVAHRATFAAEVAGCQVEIGAAGAMAAAAVVDAVGGTARQACDAAAIAFQNTMGSVCDLVQGMVEIPCHTRNAAAAASAFVCADLVLGGYHNPIGLDETVDAVYDVGRMMPAELRCTARGGLAVTPSAVALKRRAPGPSGRM
jgi:L-serine dehydratase